MTLREEIGQLITVGGITGGLAQGGGEAAVRRAIAAGEVGGVYVGYPHFRSPEQARALIERLQATAPTPLFVAADFETGPAYNCEGHAAHLPYLMGLGFIGDPAATRQTAELTARQALAMGINWLYSPCLDVNLRPDNPIVGIRSFGETPELVSAMGNAFIRGCLDVGLLCTAKHFPGGGNVVADAHISQVQDVGDLATWEAKTLPPFVAAIRNGVPSIMTNHAAVPFLDPTLTPATFSRAIITGILRQRLGYDGLIVTDSLGMEGAGGNAGLPDRCLSAFEAGCDVLLSPYDPGIVPRFEEALQSGRITRARLEASVKRVMQAKARLSALSRLEFRAEDETTALAIGSRAARVLRDNGALPLVPGSFAVVTQWRNEESQYFPREPGVLVSLQHGLQLTDPGAPLLAVSRACPESEHADILARVRAVPMVVIHAIVKNYAGDPYHGRLSDGTVLLIRKCRAAGKRVTLVLLGSPYPAAQVPEAETVLCTGGDTLGSVEGVLALLNRTQPHGGSLNGHQ